MKRVTVILIGSLALMAVKVNGQQSITSAGGVFQNDMNSLSWGVGEVAIETLIANPYILTQGFQQSLLTVTAIDETPRIDVNVNVYPNPINNFVKIDLSGTQFEEFEYQLFGPKGDVIETNRFEAESIEISFQNLNSGIYFLKVADDDHYSKTFRIVKN